MQGGLYSFPLSELPYGVYNAYDYGVRQNSRPELFTGAIREMIKTLPTKSTVIVPPGRYNFDPFTVNRDISFLGYGAKLTAGGKSGTHVTIAPTLNPPVNEITEPSIMQFSGFQISGNFINPPAIGQNCLLIDGASKIDLNDLKINQFVFGYGIQFTNTQGAANDRTGINVGNPRISFCSTGINHTTRGEYVTVSGGTINHGGNGTGVIIGAGNVIYDGTIITGFTTGIQLIAGSNDAHGIFNAVECNHNFDAVVASGITLGHTFNACHFYGGNMTHTNCVGITYRGCKLSPQTQVISFINTNGCKMVDNDYADTTRLNIKVQPEGSVYFSDNRDFFNNPVAEMNPAPIPNTYFKGYFNGYAPA